MRYRQYQPTKMEQFLRIIPGQTHMQKLASVTIPAASSTITGEVTIEGDTTNRESHSYNKGKNIKI